MKDQSEGIFKEISKVFMDTIRCYKEFLERDSTAKYMARNHLNGGCDENIGLKPLS
jgi:hypothetical protein